MLGRVGAEIAEVRPAVAGAARDFLIGVAPSLATRQCVWVTIDVPLDRWGRIIEPAESAGAYLLVERENGEGWKKPPPADALRLWHRTPGAEDDDDLKNWTVWFTSKEAADWFDRYTFDKWLAEGVEPDWTSA